jgi:nitroimidazol reductase NimA-like FMN-containing flavoprotein (pyridoxamine 5'-phosphate oxidase superfamily)
VCARHQGPRHPYALELLYVYSAEQLLYVYSAGQLLYVYSAGQLLYVYSAGRLLYVYSAGRPQVLELLYVLRGAVSASRKASRYHVQHPALARVRKPAGSG